MKKLFVSLSALLITSAAFSQKPFIKGGVSVQNKTFTQDLAIGVEQGANQFSVVGETYNTPTLLGQERLYFAGVQYGRLFSAGGNNSLVPFAAAKIQLNRDTYGLTFEPGVNYQLHIGEGFKLVPSISTQITDNSPVVFKAGVGAQINF